MLNLEGISAEAKIGKILILVSIILGILLLLFIGVLGGIMYTAGTLFALNISLTIPLLILVPLFLVKVVGLVMGFFALLATERRDFSRAGIFAIISCVLPPLDLVMLIGGIFFLVSREANEQKAGGESGAKSEAG
ncbi:MAG: hypothetical protein MUC66_01270 [Methanolinea sp.]|nr:hypothetical protein [Methanolinea sp.]